MLIKEDVQVIKPKVIETEEQRKKKFDSTFNLSKMCRVV
jgi:hypothetical protein